MKNQNIYATLCAVVLCLPATLADCSWKTEPWMWFEGQKHDYDYFVGQNYSGQPLPDGCQVAQATPCDDTPPPPPPADELPPPCDQPPTEQPVENPPQQPEGSAPSDPAPATLGEVTPIEGGLQGSGTTTRYWDCCKPSCAWSEKTTLAKPALSCYAGGDKVMDPQVTSGCDGGGAWTCTDNQPFVSSDPNVSYGFAATIQNSESRYCCACFRLTFPSEPKLAGKQMIVQVTNSGNDVAENEFDLLMPGGGMGQFSGCQKQFSALNVNWGNQDGGVDDESQCDQLPESLQDGCYWRFGWFGGADNPAVDYQEVTCPKELVDKSGCSQH